MLKIWKTDFVYLQIQNTQKHYKTIPCFIKIAEKIKRLIRILVWKCKKAPKHEKSITCFIKIVWKQTPVFTIYLKHANPCFRSGHKSGSPKNQDLVRHGRCHPKRLGHYHQSRRHSTRRYVTWLQSHKINGWKASRQAC